MKQEEVSEEPRAESMHNRIDEDPEVTSNLPNLKTVSWMKQFSWTLWKNQIILTRRPIALIFLLISGILSMVLSWSVGKDADDSIYPPFSECGTWEPSFFEEFDRMEDWEEKEKMQISLNDQWRSGTPVALMSLGPCLNTIIMFVFVHNEMHSQLFGVLRSLGLRESVHWASWYVPFAIIACINSLLAAITCQFLPGNVYESVYFGGVFTSMFLLQVALIPSAFFMAALAGTRRKALANFLIFLLLCSSWIPFIVQNSQSHTPSPYDYVYSNPMPKGLFWYYTSTLAARPDYSWEATYNWTAHYEDDNATYPPTQYTLCNTPILSEFEGTNLKPEYGTERDNVQQEDIFVGCYSAASWSVKIWHDDDIVARIAMFFFPYFHFQNIWGHYAGYTSLPDNKFTAEELSLSAGELAIKALPTDSINPLLAFDSKYAPQGSTLIIEQYHDYYNNYDWENPKTVCPASNPNTGNYGFCTDFFYNDCLYAKDPGPMQSTPSANDMFGFLVLLSVVYLLLASYVAQVLPGLNGRGEPFYFPFLPSYWFGKGGKQEEDSRDESQFVGVHINDVKKKYGSFEALKGVSFSMAAGEVTALLGHNGAGKTTLSNILCCNIGATTGKIRVFEHDIGQDQFAIRQMVGLCKQDDYLWPTLSAREHLELFAGLRGITKDEIEGRVSKWLRSVDLEEVQLQYASSYSGGMKRRLSLALATIGDRPLIILDEPTTGMDPVSRRFVWRHIDEIKEGRVILLTTHAMEEADLLADEVAIIRDGELAAFGSPLQLKSEHGTALQFSLLVDEDKKHATAAYIETFFSSAKSSIDVDSSSPGSITLKILSMTDEPKSDGVHANTLSDFVAWLDSDESPVKEYGFSNSSLEEVFLAVTGTHSQAAEMNQEDDAIIIVPDVEEGDAAGLGIQSPMVTFEPEISFRKQTVTIFMDMWKRSWIGKGAITNYIIYAIFVVGCLVLGFGTAMDWDASVFFFLLAMFTSLIILSIISSVYSDKTEGLLYLMQSQGLLSKAYVAGISLYGLSVYLVYGLIMLGGFFGTSMFREPIECPFIEDDWGYPREMCSMNDWDKPFGSVPNQQLNYIDFQGMHEGLYVSLRAARSPGGFGMIAAIIVCFALTGVGAVLCTAFLPGNRIPLVFVMLCILVASIWPIIDIRMVSEFEYELCQNMTDPEQICRSNLSVNNTAKEILNCAGLDVASNILPHLCLDPAASILPQIGLLQTLTFAYYSKVTFVSNPPSFAEDILMNLPGFKEMSCDGRTCEFPLVHQMFRENILYMCLGAVILFLLGIFLTCLLAFPFGPFVYIRRIFRAIADILSCKNMKSTNGSSRDASDGGDAELQEVTQERQQVTELCHDFVSGEGTSRSPLKIHMNKVPRNDVPPVVARGLTKVYPALGGRPPKVALKDFDLHVPKGQTLGLLGKNGAGKTTALKILAGAHESTSGVGLVVGHDCNTEKLKIFERLGNCAQFDVIWKNRRVRDHLEFFAMLKGVPRSKATKVARSAATAVGLRSVEEFHRNAGDLSGGMRRRLSIAISLIGSPNVNILDEPTTGLDPATRNSIWKLVKSFASPDRSTIITTHMMIEADTLCDRIAIVKDGALKVVGTQQYLKDNFGSGYNLQLNLVKSTPMYQEKAMTFVRKNLHEGAELAIRQAKTLHVALPRDLSLERVFRALYSKERETEGGINQFLLSQSSLEDVFLRMSE